MTTLATAWVDVRPDTSKLGPELSAKAGAAADKAGTESGKRFNSRFGSALKVAGLLAGAFAVTKGAQFLKGSIDEASDLNESLNAVNVTFGKNAGGIKKLGREAADAVGLSNSEFNGLAVQFSAFAGVIAGKGGDVVGTMDDLSTRGADFASVMNLDVNEAMTLFQSGLAGESEPLRKFGINLSAAAVESHAYARGIAEAGKPLTEQQKVQARYSLLMKQTSKAQGDFANTSDGLANSQRILGARTDDLKAAIGARLLPVITDAVTWVADFVKGMQDGTGAGGTFASVIRTTGNVISTVVGFLIHNKEAVAGFIAVLGGFLIFSKITKAVAAFNLVLAANPIGIVVVAIAALVAGLIYAYKNSETFRNIVNGAFKAVGDACGFMWNRVIKPVFSFLIKAWLNVAGWIISGAAKAFGWVPGIGPKLKTAARWFEQFKEDVNGQLDGIRDRNVKVNVHYKNVGGNIIPSKGPVAHGIGMNAAGTNNWRGGLSWVGERGPELLNLPRGSQIIPNHKATRLTSRISVPQFAGDASGGRTRAEAGNTFHIYDRSGDPVRTAHEVSRQLAWGA